MARPLRDPGPVLHSDPGVERYFDLWIGPEGWGGQAKIHLGQTRQTNRLVGGICSSFPGQHPTELRFQGMKKSESKTAFPALNYKPRKILKLNESSLIVKVTLLNV
jgi:hypothetical protein